MYNNISSVYCRTISSQTKVINPIALRKAKIVYSFGLSSAIGLSKVSSLRSAALVVVLSRTELYIIFAMSFVRIF